MWHWSGRRGGGKEVNCDVSFHTSMKILVVGFVFDIMKYLM